MLQRDDQHHQREKGRVEPFKGEFAEGGAFDAGQALGQIVIPRNARRHVDQADNDHGNGQPVDELQAKILFGLRVGLGFGHAPVFRLQSETGADPQPAPEVWMTAYLAQSGRL